MYIVTILAIFILAQIIAYKVDKKLADTLPVMCCGFILVLYILSFFKMLNVVDYIGIPVLLIGSVWLWKNGLIKKFFEELFSIQNIIIICFLLLITLSQISRIAVDEMDIKYWATDIKFLWNNNGLAGKSGGVVGGYGFNPPAVNLFKWFYAHMSPNKLVEGLEYAGYMSLNFIMLLPFISNLDKFAVTKEEIVERSKKDVGIKVAPNKKYYVSDTALVSKFKVSVAGYNHDGSSTQINPVGCFIMIGVNVLACILLILLPSIVSGACLYGSGGQTTAGIIFGMLLLAIYDMDDMYTEYSFARIGLLGAVLILCTSTSILWLLMAIAFAVVVYIYRKKGEKFNKLSFTDTKTRYGAYTLLGWGVIYISWVIYALVTGNSGGVFRKLIELFENESFKTKMYMADKLDSWIKTLLFYPIHVEKNWLLDLSVVTAVFVFLLLLEIMVKTEVIDKKLNRYITFYVVCLTIITYVFILVGHITIYAQDTIYYEEKMVQKSIVGFGEPYILGVLILIFGIFAKSLDKLGNDRPVADQFVKQQIEVANIKATRRTYIIIAIVVLLTFNYKAGFYGLISYRFTLESDIQTREAVLDDEEKRFVETVTSNYELQDKRVLYIKNASDYRENHNPYISYFAAPISVAFDYLDYDCCDNELNEKMQKYNAQYSYIEETGELVAYSDTVDIE